MDSNQLQSRFRARSTAKYPLTCQRAFPACTLGAAVEDTTTSSSQPSDTAPSRESTSAQVTFACDAATASPSSSPGTALSTWRGGCWGRRISGALCRVRAIPNRCIR